MKTVPFISLIENLAVLKALSGLNSIHLYGKTNKQTVFFLILGSLKVVGRDVGFKKIDPRAGFKK